MAQKIFLNWKDGLNSFDMNQMFLGMLPAGRYCGFDIMAPSTLNFTLAHTTTGVVQTDISKNPTNPTGVLLTKQGMVIQESATITGLTAVTNAGNATPRVDLVIVDHSKVNSPGGSAATYIVVKGFLSGSGHEGEDPALPLPNQQIIVGRLTIPANVATLASATWVPAPVGGLGGQDIYVNYPTLKQTFAQLNVTNAFGKRQDWQAVTTAMTVGGSNQWTVPTTGNMFRSVANQTMKEIIGPAGTILYISNISNNLTIQLNATATAGGIKINCPALENIGLPKSSGVTTISLIPGELVAFIKYGATYNMVCTADVLQRYTRAGKQFFTDASSTGQSMSGSSASILLFNSTNSDDDSLLSASGSVFTAPATGRYQLSCYLDGYVNGNATAGAYSVRLMTYINGSQGRAFGGGGIHLGSTVANAALRVGGTGFVDLTAGDTLSVQSIPFFALSNNHEINATHSSCQVKYCG